MRSAMEQAGSVPYGNRETEATRRSARNRHPIVLCAASLGGITMLALGVWAFFAPASFADFVAVPYHRHLLHDAGAFQIGIGVALLLALVWGDGLAVALGGYITASGFHLASHLMDRGLGGRDTDAPALGLLFLVGLCGFVVRGRDLAAEGRGERGEPTPAPSLAPFARQRDVLLTTYRRDGAPKGTPVHIAVRGNVAYFRTWDATWKVRRIRNNPAVTIAPATARGVPTGPPVRADARILDGADATTAARALARKYPILHGFVIPLVHRSRGYRTVHVELSPHDA